MTLNTGFILYHKVLRKHSYTCIAPCCSLFGDWAVAGVGDVTIVHPPLAGEQAAQTVLAKSYIWWLDDPWAALIALTAISILLCIVGIIVLVFTHARYVTVFLRLFICARRVCLPWIYGIMAAQLIFKIEINLNCKKKVNKKSRRKYLKDCTCTPFNAKNVKHAYLN